MLWHLPFAFSRPLFCIAGVFLVGLIFCAALARRIRLTLAARIFVGIGMMLLAVAAGEPDWLHRAFGSVVVMVDLSPSTRGATFRDRAALVDRIHQVLGDQPYELLAFSDHTQPLPADLVDLPCDRTLFSPPAADAVLLFSDGQFQLSPYSPPVYPVIDPAMDHPADAAVTGLLLVGQQVVATVHNTDGPRTAHWSGAIAEGGAPPAATGDFSSTAIPTGRGEVTASLDPADLWPENDSLSLARPLPIEQQRWWIGRDAPAGWRGLDPQSLPTDPSDYLQPAIIVLRNIPADALSSIQQQRLVQYVRDLGGGLVLVGGDHAFAAGHYDGTLLDTLSPLASSPPGPSSQWLLLIDSSGSMAGDGSTPSPWQTEVEAVTHLLPQLPEQDSLGIGSFAESLRWWSTGKSVAETQHLQLPPQGVGPSGPTNLAAALNQIASSDEGVAPTQLLLMTDADADLPNPQQLATAFTARKIHLHLLAIGDGSALSALRLIAARTGGSVIQQLDSRQWVKSATLLLRSALPDRYQHRPIEITPGPRVIQDWNQTWLRPSAIPLEKSADAAVSAEWQLGLGKVTAIAYPADANQVQAFAKQIQTAPADPRFTLTCTEQADLDIHIRAIDGNQYLNGQSFQVEMRDPADTDSPPALFAVLQTAPGEYQRALPSPRSSRWITIRNGATTIKRFTVAGRYAPEFDVIGNNIKNLQALADRSGGAVIAPGPVQPIDFHWPKREVPIGSETAFAGFVMIGLGLVLHHRLPGGR